MQTILANWKTSVSGVAIIALGVAFVLGHITIQQFTAAVSLVAGGGLLAAQDGATAK